MTSEVFALLLDKRATELHEKAVDGDLNRMELAELRALVSHQDKTPAVVHRIRILAAKMAEPTRWERLLGRFSKKFKQNLSELEALVQYGNSKAVWEIAYLHRKKAVMKLDTREESELENLMLYHDSPDVLRITELKVKEQFGYLTADESRELTDLNRNLYRKGGVPNQLLELFWPAKSQQQLDFSRLR